MMRRLFWIPMITLLGCDDLPEQVILTGVLRAGPGVEEVLPGATVTVLDTRGQAHASATTDDNGVYEVWAPAGDAVFVDVEAAGHVTASFVGITGLEGIQHVEEGTVFGFSEAELQSWESRFAGCPGLGGGTVLGEVRVHNLIDPDTDDHPSVGTANVVVQDASGAVHAACYLDDEGEAWDPESALTGGSGTFLIGSVPPGPDHTLIVRFQIAGDHWVEEQYPVRVTEGGVAPRFPVWVDWPM